MNTVSAATVRDWAKANPKSVPGKAWKSIKGRGRLHPELVKAFNRAKRGRQVYTVGVADNKRVTLKAGNKTIVVDTSTLRNLDGTAGKRGRISTATKQKYLASL